MTDGVEIEDFRLDNVRERIATRPDLIADVDAIEQAASAWRTNYAEPLIAEVSRSAPASSTRALTEQAKVDFPHDVSPEDLVSAVEATGYSATLPTVTGDVVPPVADDTASLRVRLAVSAALTVPVLALSMMSALRFDHWQWMVLALATPVVVWGAWPFHVAAWSSGSCWWV